MCFNSSDRLRKVVGWQLQAETDGLALEDEWKVTQSSDTAARLSVSVSVWQMIHVSACITQETPEESTRRDSTE